MERNSRKHRSDDRYERKEERRHERRDKRRDESRDERRHERRDDRRYERRDERRRETSDERSAKRHRSDDRRHQRREGDQREERHEFHRSVKRENTSDDKNEKPKEKEKPNFGLSGKLAEDTNVFNGVVIKYNEPPEAKCPKRKWRLYPFKGEEALPFIPIHKQSAFLLGRDRKVADIPIDHPSCSKQHAVIQFRVTEYDKEDGTVGKRVLPYIIDLESANGTFLNNQRLEARRYYELLEKDVIKFGYSSREYVLLHEGSKEDETDDIFTE
ncbi:smad nuclear-interacting protein 1-like protein [Dinothrombium tinctorium]|uniref:Smad nuclear-interacting protein 1-like protein n=1 Tax=Dinothrombium tinctorium TaxID=1965070 RepID=A0A3S3PNM3_9ACAR|nr:smad nuclear-interacting protein 1-like protein [Dinothrombium tinctorium]